MTFGQSTGPPASAKQVAYLKSLLVAAGYADFREARHAFGLTQRQAGGRFTGPEASELIDRLLGNEPEPAPEPPRMRSAAPAPDAQALVVRALPADVLAAELRRRGWAVTPPA